MSWDIVVAALGGSIVTGVISYFVSAKTVSAELHRSNLEARTRFDQIRAEQRNQLQQQAIQHRTEYRRERLLPLQQTISRLYESSERYRHLAQAKFIDAFGEPYETIDDLDKKFSEAGKELWTNRREVFWPIRDSVVSSQTLADALQRVDTCLIALENEARQWAEEGAATKQTRERAAKAAQELRQALIDVTRLIEEQISGTDLVDTFSGK